MNINQEIVNGYVNPKNRFKFDRSILKNNELPSKLGGIPILLNKEDKLEEVKCQNCSKQMTFLLQIFAPLEYANTYYRALYVYYCQSIQCRRSPKSIRILRTQASKSLNISESADFNDSKELSVLAQEYVIENDFISPKDTQKAFKLAQEKINSFDVDDEDLQYDKIDQNYTKEEQMLKQFKMNDEKEADLDWGPDEDDEADCIQDKCFFIYNEFMNYEDQPIMKYCRYKDTEPLWFSDKNQWKNKQITKCRHCGGALIYEFQINSCLLNHYKELIDYDWGIIVAYTCSKSCDSKDQKYLDELVLIQFGEEEKPHNQSMHMVDLKQELQNIQEDQLDNLNNEEKEEAKLADDKKAEKKKKNKKNKQKQVEVQTKESEAKQGEESGGDQKQKVSEDKQDDDDISW